VIPDVSIVIDEVDRDATLHARALDRQPWAVKR
jgi:hypothetical protein